MNGTGFGDGLVTVLIIIWMGWDENFLLHHLQSPNDYRSIMLAKCTKQKNKKKVFEDITFYTNMHFVHITTDALI